MKVTLGRAINLLNAGYSVMPIGEGKRPLIKWKQYQEKQITQSELERLESEKQRIWNHYRLLGRRMYRR